MKISVIAVTARMGCFDILVGGMRSQTFPQSDFEVIVVDSCYDDRFPHLPKLPPNFLYFKLPDAYDYYDACFANNFGLRQATGELVVFFSDLNWPEPMFLQRHWDVYTHVPGYVMTGFCFRWPIPELKENLTWETGAYSVFKNEFSARTAFEFFLTHQPTYTEIKGGFIGPRINGTPYYELGFQEYPGDKFYAALNESIPMEVLKEINGWDQIYDGSYGAADIDLGVRACFAGLKFLIHPHSVNGKFGTKGKVNLPGKSKPEKHGGMHNYSLFKDEMKKIVDGSRSYKAVIGAWPG